MQLRTFGLRVTLLDADAGGCGIVAWCDVVQSCIATRIFQCRYVQCVNLRLRTLSAFNTRVRFGLERYRGARSSAPLCTSSHQAKEGLEHPLHCMTNLSNLII